MTAAPRRARVLIVDDHPLVREGLAAHIAAQPDMEVCGEASGVEDALALLRNERPNLMIVDLALKSGHGLDLIKKVKASGLDTKMLVVSAFDESLFAERAVRAGAHGYLNKQKAQDVVIDALRSLLRDELHLSATLAQRLAVQALLREKAKCGAELLTDRELQIFELIGRGNGTRSIAAQLHRSVHTIESHREKIRLKLGLRNGTELMRSAVQWVLENCN